MERSHSNGTHGSNATATSSPAGSNAGSAFTLPMFSPGAASLRSATRKGPGQRCAAARSAAARGIPAAMDGQPAATSQAAASGTAATADSVLGSAGRSEVDSQARSRRESRPVRLSKGASPQQGRRVRPAWVSGVQPDESDADGSKPAYAPSQPEPPPSFVFSGFTMGTTADQNASPDRHPWEDAGKTASAPAFSFGTAGMRSSFSEPPAGSRPASGVPPSPKRVMPQAPLAARAEAGRQDASPRFSPQAPDLSEPLLSRQFAGFTLGRAPAATLGLRTPPATRATLAGAFQRVSLNQGAAESLVDRFQSSVRVGDPAASAAKTPSGAARPYGAAAAQPAAPEPTPVRGAGFTFGGQTCRLADSISEYPAACTTVPHAIPQVPPSCLCTNFGA